jgi:hypothetical protein
MNFACSRSEGYIRILDDKLKSSPEGRGLSPIPRMGKYVLENKINA